MGECLCDVGALDCCAENFDCKDNGMIMCGYRDTGAKCCTQGRCTAEDDQCCDNMVCDAATSTCKAAVPLYKEVTEGYDSNSCKRLTTIEECENAAKSLGKPDTSADQIADQSLAAYCFYGA